jgi:hypothetical protein
VFLVFDLKAVMVKNGKVTRELIRQHARRGTRSGCIRYFGSMAAAFEVAEIPPTASGNVAADRRAKWLQRRKGGLTSPPEPATIATFLQDLPDGVQWRFPCLPRQG